jgi:hypothetical protein
MNGDGDKDILVTDGANVFVYSARINALLQTIVSPSTETHSYQTGLFVVAGDLNADGVSDLARYDDFTDQLRGIPYRRVILQSGLDGRTLGFWSGCSR